MRIHPTCPGSKRKKTNEIMGDRPDLFRCMHCQRYIVVLTSGNFARHTSTRPPNGKRTWL